jgi:hypothetical protein
MTTHAAPLDAVHSQSRVRPIESVPEPPAAGEVSIEFVRLTLHRELDGAVVDCCSAAVQEMTAARGMSASSRAAAMRRGEPELVRFERSGSRLMRNLGA